MSGIEEASAQTRDYADQITAEPVTPQGSTCPSRHNPPVRIMSGAPHHDPQHPLANKAQPDRPKTRVHPTRTPGPRTETRPRTTTTQVGNRTPPASSRRRPRRDPAFGGRRRAVSTATAQPVVRVLWVSLNLGDWVLRGGEYSFAASSSARPTVRTMDIGPAALACTGYGSERKRPPELVLVMLFMHRGGSGRTDAGMCEPAREHSGGVRSWIDCLVTPSPHRPSG